MPPSLPSTLAKAGIQAEIHQTADDAGYIRTCAYIRHQAWEATRRALNAAGIPGLVADYGNELQIVTTTAPRTTPDTEDDTAEPTEAIPEIASLAETVRAPQYTASAAAGVANILRPWWRVHRTEPKCIANAIRQVYGPTTPCAGSYYRTVSAAIDLLEAERKAADK